LYIDIKTRARPHFCIVFYFLVFYSRSYIQPDDGYIRAAEACSCFHIYEKLVCRL